LTNPIYADRLLFNYREVKARRIETEAKVIEVAVPEIISPAIFESVQKTLKIYDPLFTPPRVVNSPILLSCLAHCDLPPKGGPVEC
jgi:hypothetical protein